MKPSSPDDKLKKVDTSANKTFKIDEATNKKFARTTKAIIDEKTNMFLTFAIGSESYGIEVSSVVEIIRASMITPLPDVYYFIKGVINLRGKILPVIDFRARLNLSNIEYDDRTCIIIVQHKEVNVGVIVDRVTEVLTIALSKIEPKPKISSTSASRFVTNIVRIGDSVKTILDIEKLLFDLSESDIESKKHIFLEKINAIEELQQELEPPNNLNLELNSASNINIKQ